MSEHPMRQALLPAVQRLLAEAPTGVGGIIALEYAKG